MRTALTSVKIGWLAYVIPFVFVFSPGLMMNGSFGVVAIAVATLIAGIFLISIAMTGYFLRPIGLLRRAVAFLTGCFLCIPINSFALADALFAVAATSGLLFLASEIVMTRRAAGLSGGNKNA